VLAPVAPASAPPQADNSMLEAATATNREEARQPGPPRTRIMMFSFVRVGRAV
jgi:hypothetical protein